MHARLVTAVAAVAALAGPVPSADAGLWSPPADVGPPADYVYGPTLVPAPSGGLLASWTVRAQPRGAGALPGAVPVVAGDDNDGETGRMARLGAGGAAPSVTRTSDTIAAGPALDASGRGVVLRTRVRGSDANGYRRVRLAWSAVIQDGRLGATRTLTTATLVSAPALAVDARGDAVAAWAEYAPPRRHEDYGRVRVVASWRRARGAFGHPVTLLRSQHLDFEHGGAVRAAVSPAGRAVVVYDDASIRRRREHRRLVAWTGTPRHRFSRTLTVGPHDGFADAAPVVTRGGRVVVVWGSQDGGEEANRPWVVRAATLAPRAHRFSRPQILDDGPGVGRPMGDVVAVAGPGGQVLAAWSGVRGSGRGVAFPVQAATTDARGRFGAPEVLAASGAVGGAAVRSDGEQVVTWARALGEQMTDQAQAALRAPGQPSFGAPEPIAAPDVASPPAVAFDGTGSPVAVWAARPGGEDPSHGVTTTAVLRVSSRARP